MKQVQFCKHCDKFTNVLVHFIKFVFRKGRKTLMHMRYTCDECKKVQTQIEKDDDGIF